MTTPWTTDNLGTDTPDDIPKLADTGQTLDASWRVFVVDPDGNACRASLDELRLALGIAATIFSTESPAGKPGQPGQQYWHQRTSSLTDVYAYEGGSWRKKTTLTADGGTVYEIDFNAGGASVETITFTSGTAGTYALPTSGTDVQGLSGIAYARDGVAITDSSAAFAAGNVLTIQATAGNAGGKLFIRPQ